MFILADIGGTKLRVAGTTSLSQFTEPVVLDTPHDYDDMLALVTRVARNIAGSEPINAAALGVIGVLAEDRRSILKAPGHHAPWSGRELAGDIETALDTAAVLENDTALVGLGEAVSGAGAGAGIVAYMTVSTGVNGVRIEHGSIDRTHRGFEIGGQYVEGGLSLEELVSGSAIEAAYGAPPKDLGADNPLWDELARILAVGVHNTILHWSPEVFVFGGSMFNRVGISVDRVAEYAAELMRKFPDLPPFVHSQLGDVGGLWGGMALLNSLISSSSEAAEA